MVIPNITLLCDIIYNLEISQSAKKAKLLKINLPINYHDFKKKLNILQTYFWPTKRNFNKYKIGHIMVSYSHVTFPLHNLSHVISAQCLLITIIPLKKAEKEKLSKEGIG